MRYISSGFRLIRIHFILVRYNLDEILFSAPIFYPFRFLMYFNPWYWALKNKLTRGERIRLALEALGPIFIKAGQVLSTRRDLIPEDVSEELVKLQDRVPPFSGKLAKQIIETALRQPINAVFSEFNSEPLASASIAQVHAATLLDGKSAVVKVLRPGIKNKIDHDIDLLFTLANLADKYWVEGRRFKPKEIVDEVAHTLYDELDLLREGANASQLRRNFKDSPLLYVPEIYWTHSRGNILVMERIEGIPIHNVAGIRAAGINLKKLAERGVEVFFTNHSRRLWDHGIIK
jgi:ubiquinone biosynthesis protein